jgi:dolichol-phosphate mannosyltransferase
MPRTRATVCRWRASNATRTVPRLSALVDSVIVPTYNEAASLPLLVGRLAPAMRDREWELVVVDDGSPDGTADVAEKLGATYPVRVLRRAGKAGLASAVIAGMKEARGDVLVVMDADLSHPPEIVPDLLAVIDAGVDLAVGSRYVSGGATLDWPLRRRVVSRVACFLGNTLVPVHDATSGFFAVRRSAIDGVRLNAIGFKIGFEVIARANARRIVEVPYTFRDRELGASKFGRREIGQYLLQLGIVARDKVKGRLR